MSVTAKQLMDAFTLFWAKKMRQGSASRLTGLEQSTLHIAFDWLERNYTLETKPSRDNDLSTELCCFRDCHSTPVARGKWGPVCKEHSIPNDQQ